MIFICAATNTANRTYIKHIDVYSLNEFYYFIAQRRSPLREMPHPQLNWTFWSVFQRSQSCLFLPEVLGHRSSSLKSAGSSSSSPLLLQRPLLKMSKVHYVEVLTCCNMWERPNVPVHLKRYNSYTDQHWSQNMCIYIKCTSIIHP